VKSPDTMPLATAELGDNAAMRGIAAEDDSPQSQINIIKCDGSDENPASR